MKGVERKKKLSPGQREALRGQNIEKMEMHNTIPPFLTITEIINRYFAALDQKEFDLETMGRIFSEDAKVLRPNGTAMLGLRAIGESHAQSMSRFRVTQHLPSGFIIDSIDNTTARFRGNLVAIHFWAEAMGNPDADPNDNFFLAGGVTTGQVALFPNGWRITELANQIIWRRGIGFEQMQKTK